MAAARYYADPQTRPKLEPSLYNLHGEELAFFQKLTGIEDEDELKSHVLNVQAKAYEVFGYPCIKSFSFTKLKIAKLQPAYSEALKLLQERKDPIFLDIGCCFGNDARKAVLDGWPAENVIASDLRQGFWDYGHELFKSTPETFPATFVPGDAFDLAMIKPRGAFITEDDISSVFSTATPPLKDLTSLTPLQGKFSAIHASSFFHLFSEEKQLELAHRVASLLSPEKGSIIFGVHGALPTKGFRPIIPRKFGEDGQIIPTPGSEMFCHSPESWTKLWTDDVFGGNDGKGSERIKVYTQLIEIPRTDLAIIMQKSEDTQFWMMGWSITRL